MSTSNKRMQNAMSRAMQRQVDAALLANEQKSQGLSNKAALAIRGPTQEQETEIPLDPLARLVTEGHPQAVVSLTVGKSANYGELRISASVTYSCDQNEKTVNEAGFLAFEKATELVSDAWGTLLAEVR